MQEYAFDIKDALVNGLRTDVRRGLTAPFLDSMQNCKPSPFGVIGVEVLDDVAALGSLAWPTPFAFKTHSKLYSITTKLAEITTVGDPSGWTAATVDTYLPLSEADPGTSLTNGAFATDSDWQKGTGWTISDGTATHAVGTGSDLIQLEADQVSGKELIDGQIYRIRFEISTKTAGSLTPKCGTNAGEAALNNGAYTQYIKCSGSLDFTITASSTFDGSVDNVTVAKIGKSSSFAVSGPWHVAQMGDSWFAVNGDFMLYRANVPGSGDIVHFFDSEIQPDTVTVFDDRIWFGGLNTSSDWFSDSRFTRLWNAWRLKTETQPTDLGFDPTVDGARMVMWGTRLGGDVYRPHIMELAALGLPDSNIFDQLEAALFDAINRGDIGFAFLPMSNVKRLLPLGQTLIAYGTDGVAHIGSVSSRSGYAVREVSEVGVAGRGAVVAIDEQTHLLIDTQGYLWRNTLEGMKRLGYSEFFSNMVGSDITMVLDELNSDVYISDGTNGAYVMTANGLGEVYKSVVSITPWSTGYTVTRMFAVGSAGEDETIIKSPPFDMDSRAIKTIHGMGIDGLWEGETANIYAFIEYRYKNTESWSASRDYLLNKEGECSITVAGVEFRACVRFDSEPLSGNHRVGRIRVRYKTSDKRFSRGISAAGPQRSAV